MGILLKIDNAIARFEGWLLILLLSAMVCFAFLQVVLRNLFHTGIFWLDPFNRHLVLWVGLLGASLSTKTNKHINVDILSKLVSKKYKPCIDMIIYLLCMAMSIILCKASFDFVQMEKEFGTVLFLNVQTWIMETIIPIAFCLFAFRFLLHFLNSFVTFIARGRS